MEISILVILSHVVKACFAYATLASGLRSSIISRFLLSFAAANPDEASGSALSLSEKEDDFNERLRAEVRQTIQMATKHECGVDIVDCLGEGTQW